MCRVAYIGDHEHANYAGPALDLARCPIGFAQFDGAIALTVPRRLAACDGWQALEISRYRDVQAARTVHSCRARLDYGG